MSRTLFATLLGDPPPKVDPPSLPDDLRSGAFFEVTDVRSDYVELKTEEAQVVLPISSIRVILLGEKGSLGTRSTRPTGFSGRPEDSFRPFRGE